jgi:hypothetical protein
VSTNSPSPLDALSAFATAALADARKAAAGSADPRVSIAFSLGWQMAEIYRPDRRVQFSPANPEDLPGLSRLDAGEWTEIGLDQVQAGITKLQDTIIWAGLEVPDAQAFADYLEPLGEAERATAIRAFHVDLLGTLTAADFRLGKAYGLGRALADTTREPEDYRAELGSGRVATVAAWIRELSSAMPPHAGHVVAKSLEAWSWWTESPESRNFDEGRTRRELRAQGRLWRAMLSGEKRATDVLEPGDYLSAGERMLQSSGALAWRFLRHYRWLALLVILLFVAGVVVMFTVGSAAAIASGAAAIITSLGLGWKGIGVSVGGAAARLEAPLWGSALDDAVYERVTPQRIVDYGRPRKPGPDEPSLVAAAHAHPDANLGGSAKASPPP